MLIKIEEKSENNEHVFELVVDEKLVCTAKTLGYELLETIDCIPSERRRKHAMKLLTYIHEVARQNSVKTIRTSDIDSRDVAAVCFFKSMGYTLEPLDSNNEFLEGRKDLEKVLEKSVKIPDSKAVILLYLFQYSGIDVKQKYPYTSLKCIAEACNLPVSKADGILEYLRKGKLVEKSHRCIVPPEYIYFQITKKGIKFLFEKYKVLIERLRLLKKE